MAAADRDAVDRAVVRGSDLLKQGKLEAAQQVFREALELDPDNPRVLALLGLAHFRGGQFERARAIYEELVERLPTDASHRLNLGLVYLKLGDATKAIQALEASRALDPSQGRAVSYLGLAYARAGRYPEAYRSFLLAGQAELASEIESNLTAAERDGIHAQLQRSGVTARPEEPPPTPQAPAPQAPAPQAPAPQAPAPQAPGPPAAPVVSDDPSAPRMSDSLQFVMPTRVGGPPAPADGRSMISHAVDTASPAAAGAAARRVAAGNQAPIPLSQLATEELVRPDDGEEPFELAPGGALVIRVVERVMTRLDGVHVTGGDLAFEPVTRHSRGRQTDEKFDYGGSQLHTVTGRGYLIAVPDKRAFTAVTLDDDIFYLREDLVFAFEARLRWENGNVPGLRGRLPVVQFRGDGAVALRSERPLVRVKLPPQGIVFVDAARLGGWIGRVIPRAVVPPSGALMGDVCVECTGEGVVLIDPVGDPGIRLTDAAPASRLAPPPPPPAPAVEDSSQPPAWLVDDPLESPAHPPQETDDDAPPGRDEF